MSHACTWSIRLVYSNYQKHNSWHHLMFVHKQEKKPPTWQKNDLVSGGHGQAGSLGGPWTGWIGSTPVQISGCGLDGALSWWCDELQCCWLWLFCAYLSFLVDGQLGCWPRRVIPLRIASDREKGRASWRQVGLPVQSLLRRRFRRACVRAYVHFVCVCVYMCMCVCVQTCIYICMCTCVCICICMRLYTCVCACVCIFVHRLWVSVSVLQRVDSVMHAHVCSCAYACVCIRV